MNSFRSNNDNLKHQRFTASDCKDIGIRKSEFVGKSVPFEIKRELGEQNNISNFFKIRVLSSVYIPSDNNV